MTQPLSNVTPALVPEGEGHLDAVDLPTGKAMLPEQSLEISCALPTRFIVVVGAADSGKTTLLASLHERFLLGPWGGFLFAGCSTFLGFEQICHEGRGVSGRETADTQRTKRSEGRRLFHLRLRVEDCSKPAQDILFSDISGEEFDTARDSGEDARELRIVKAAHRFMLLIDGGKITKLKERQQARDEATLLLRTFYEEGHLGKTSKVDVVFTKWDKVNAHDTKAQAEAFATDIERDIITKYSPQLGDLRVFRVTARDDEGRVPPATGLESALTGWVEERKNENVIPAELLSEPKAATEYDRFYRRQLPALFGGAK
jgi:hypothetical protein